MVQLVEQKITKQVTVNNGATGEITISIPLDKQVFLKGYGFTWNASTTYKLSTGFTTFPTTTAQDGSIAQPLIFSTPYECKPGSAIKLQITNNGSSKTYEAVFYILTSTLLDESSTGSDILLNTGANIVDLAPSTAFTSTLGSGAISVTGTVLEMFDFDKDTGLNLNPAGTPMDYTVQFDLGGTQLMKTVYMMYSWDNGTGGGDTTFTADYSTDGSSWTNWVTETPSTTDKTNTEVTLSSISFRYFRLRLTSGSSFGSDPTIKELHFYQD